MTTPIFVFGSNLAGRHGKGAAIDSALFVWIAFGSLDFFAGQVAGKGLMTAAVALGVGLRRRVPA